MDTKNYKYETAEPYETLDSGHHDMFQDISDNDIRKIFNVKKEEQDKKMIYSVPFNPWQANFINEKSSHDSFEDAFRN